MYKVIYINAEGRKMIEYGFSHYLRKRIFTLLQQANVEIEWVFLLCWDFRLFKKCLTRYVCEKN